MKNLTTSLYAICNHTQSTITAGKEYAVFKILTRRCGGDKIYIINDRGQLECWGAYLFTFITKG